MFDIHFMRRQALLVLCVVLLLSGCQSGSPETVTATPTQNDSQSQTATATATPAQIELSNLTADRPKERVGYAGRPHDAAFVQGVTFGGSQWTSESVKQVDVTAWNDASENRTFEIVVTAGAANRTIYDERISLAENVTFHLRFGRPLEYTISIGSVNANHRLHLTPSTFDCNYRTINVRVFDNGTTNERELQTLLPCQDTESE